MPETAASAASTAPVATASAASTAPVTSPRRRGARGALRAVQVLLALFFAVASAGPKLVAHSSAVDTFADMGWGSAGMYAIGLLELAGAIALLVPALQSVAAASLSALMVGALVVQLTYFDGEHAATPLVLMVPLLLITWTRRGHNEALLRLARRGRA